MSSDDADTTRKLTTLSTVTIALSIGAVGIGLLYAAAKMQFLIAHPGTQSVARSVAGYLVASVAIAILWQLRAKRALLNEVLAKARLGEEVRRAGLIGVGLEYLKDVNWEQMFKGAKQVDILFAYGYSWRRHNLIQLRELADQGGCKVRVALPDPDEQSLLASLGKVFGKDKEELKALIQQSKADFDTILGKVPGVAYEMWYFGEHPAFTYYRIDNVAIVVFYNHRRPYLVKPPFLKIEKGGSLFEFFREEFEFILYGNPKQDIAPPSRRAPEQLFKATA